MWWGSSQQWGLEENSTSFLAFITLCRLLCWTFLLQQLKSSVCVCNPRRNVLVFGKLRKTILANEWEKRITEILHFIPLTFFSNARSAPVCWAEEVPRRGVVARVALGNVVPSVSSVQATLRGQWLENSGSLAHPTSSVSVPSTSALRSRLLK